MLRRLALAACALTGVPLAIAWVISERAIHPRPKAEDHDLSDFDLPAREVSFPSRDGMALAGWFIAPPAANAPTPGVVLSHGHGRSRAELLPHAGFLHRAGFALLAFDYRHRGGSEGDAVTMGVREQDDLLGAIDELARHPEVDGDRVAVLGVSMGSVVAILAAARDERVRALVVEAPYATYDAIMTRALRHFYHLPSFPIAPLAKWVVERRLGYPLDHAQPVAEVHRISPRPVFFITDEQDAVIGHEEAARLFDAAGEPKRYWLIANAGHARGWQAAPEEYERRVVSFFREALTIRGDIAGRVQMQAP